MQRAKKTCNKLWEEIKEKKKLYAGHPVKFINDTFFRFNKEKEELLIQIWLFDDIKLEVTRLRFAPKNEKFNKHFISNLQTFTKHKDRFHIIWNACKIRFLFNNKDKEKYLSCIIYKIVCSCGADYVGETIHNVRKRWNEHESRTDKNSEYF